jgi:hypothetical protein
MKIILYNQQNYNNFNLKNKKGITKQFLKILENND